MKIIALFITLIVSLAYGIHSHAKIQHSSQIIDVLSQNSTDLKAENAKQMRSDYNHNMGQIMHAFDQGESKASDTVLSRIWSPNDTIAVRLRKNVGTLISIPKGERIVGFILGDQEGFLPKLLGEKLPNQIVISPTAYEIDTNLTLIDEKGRIYTLYLRSDPIESNFVPHFLVMINFPKENLSIDPVSLYNFNNGDLLANSDHGLEDIIFTKEIRNNLTKKEYDFLDNLDDSETINTEYRIYGNKMIAPKAVWDDGQHVYISFRNQNTLMRLPNLYRVVDGYAVIANSHYKDGFLITDSISQEGWMLIDGKKIVCIKVSNTKSRNYSKGIR